MEFVDAEQMARVFLRATTPDQIELTIPEPRPDGFIHLFRTGGSAENRVLERVQLTVRGWGAHRTDARERASRARSAFLSRSSMMPLVRSLTEVQGLTRSPDPKSGQERYEFTIELMVRAKR